MQIRHVGGACAWARRHRPIPKDFATFLTSHMNIDDIERVVGRRDKAELGETESEEIDCAKLLATRLMVDMYAPRKQFPFTRLSGITEGSRAREIGYTRRAGNRPTLGVRR